MRFVNVTVKFLPGAGREEFDFSSEVEAKPKLMERIAVIRGYSRNFFKSVIIRHSGP